MQAAIDVGSNTIRLLIAGQANGKLTGHQYYRKITRLSGKFANDALHPDSMQRTVEGLKSFSSCMQSSKVNRYRAVATEAVRRARNSGLFLDMVKKETGIDLEIISGETEAQLTTAGVLSVISPLPAAAIIIDIGGGSTELICVHNGETRFQMSYPLGVVRLCEELNTSAERKFRIDSIVADFHQQLEERQLADRAYQLIGTAGTVTTLAAIHLHLEKYDINRINNHCISSDWLELLYKKLEPMKIPERETITGMEAGRGDLIIPGIQILKSLSEAFGQPLIKVADSGLLEGTIATVA